jgi:hypothetical protein
MGETVLSWLSWLERMDAWLPRAVLLLWFFSPVLAVIVGAHVAAQRAWRNAWQRFPGPGWEPSDGETFEDGQVSVRSWGLYFRPQGLPRVTLRDKGIFIETRSWFLIRERVLFLPWEKIVNVELKDGLLGWAAYVWMDESGPLVYFFEGPAERIGREFLQRKGAK